MKMNQNENPLYSNCLEFIKKNQCYFFTPGHKGGRTLPREFTESIAALDLCNLPDTDTLHCPTKSIEWAEKLLADAYGVKHSFMSVGGSTLANLAGIMATLSPGDKILVQRNSHKSVIAGIINAGAIPIWLPPLYDEDFLICHGIAANQLNEALKKHPDVKAVLLLNPTYFGTVPDIQALVNIAKVHDKTVVVDEAHGAQFHFHPDFPLAAEDAGADVIIQSTHKTLSALSQGAVLHLNSDRVSAEKVRKILQLLQTTSPNFAILSSIDLARRQMALEGEELLGKFLFHIRAAREKISSIDGLRLLSKQDSFGENSGFFSLDETKFVINCEQLNMSGYELLSILNKEHRIQPELAGPSYILCILSFGNTQEEMDLLYKALASIKKKAPMKNGFDYTILSDISSMLPEMIMTPRDAFFSPSEHIPLNDCLGRICSEIVTPYPPGIPILMPGELISREIIDFLLMIREAKRPISMSDLTCETLEVISV